MDGSLSVTLGQTRFRFIESRDEPGPRYFTTAYFHRPDELAQEVRDAGFDSAELLAIEGIAWSGARFQEVWNNPEGRTAMMEFLAVVEREPSILGASAHFVALARR